MPLMNIDEKPLLISIVGPTAVGKTEISLYLAERLNGEIISADSRTFYRGLDIGTSKPDDTERRIVPHHMIDICEPSNPLSLAEFQDAVFRAISSIHDRGRLPFLVGGTGQYVRSIIEGWKIPPQANNQALRVALHAWAGKIGNRELHNKLAVLDPAAAEFIDYRNVRRTIRALEVIFFTGKRFSDQRGKSATFYSNLVIGLIRPRNELYKRIEDRIDIMLDNGWVNEVQKLLDAGFHKDIPAMSAIGYQEIIDVLQGNMSLETAKQMISKRTKELVRRQANWFKLSDPDIHWFEVNEGVKESIMKLIMAHFPASTDADNFKEVFNE